jgi:AraC-like DNA-binding protein
VRATTAVKPGDGFDHWHNVTCRNYSLTECRKASDGRFSAHIEIRKIGALAISDIAAETLPGNTIAVSRSAADIRKDPRDYFMLWLMLDGQVELEQRCHSSIMRTGDLFLYDQSQTFFLDFAHWSRALMVTIPRPLLTSRLPMVHRLVGRRLAANPSLTALVGSLVTRLYHLDDETGDDTVSRISESALDILCVALEANVDPAPGSTRHARQLEDAKRYILAHLGDPEMDLESIAKAQDMAPRTLYRLFASEGATPMRWLWQQRLVHSYKALSEGKFTRVTDVAFNYGFSDISHFSRSFKTAFGQSPRTFKRG